MPELDDELIKELREELAAERKTREVLVEELRANRPKEDAEPEPTGVDRIRQYHADQERKRKESKEQEDGDE